MVKIWEQTKFKILSDFYFGTAIDQIRVGNETGRVRDRVSRNKLHI